jgi:hypothetical protein
VLGQAASFALLAAVSPTALLVLAVYLGSAQPRRTAGLYLIGAVVMSVITAAIALIVIRATGLNLPVNRAPRYGLRLGLGVLALVAAAYIYRRTPAVSAEPGTPPGQKKLISRLVDDPTPATAFAAGLLLFAPGLTFIAAVQVVATARAGTALTAIALIIVVVISVVIVWLPFVAYLAAPDYTSRKLRALNGWLRAHGRTIMLTVLVGVGVALILNGALALIS